MKRLFNMFLALFIVGGISLVGFIDESLSQTKPIELKFAQWDPPQALLAKLSQEMVDRINERSGGRLKVTAYFGQTLLKQAESFRSVQLGVADMSYFGPTAPGSPVELGRIISLPFLGITSHEMITEVYTRLLNESPELQAEYKGLKVLGPFGIPMDNLHLTKRPVHVPADMKGMKIIALGPRIDFIKATGATPVTLPSPDWYTSLERGLVEGLYFLFPVLPVFGLEDRFEYHTVINASGGVNMFIFNEKKWNSIPPDLQKVIIEATEWRISRSHKNDRSEDERIIALMKQKGHTVYYPTPEEMKLWEEAAKPVHEQWISSLEKKGLPARKVYEQLKRIISEVKK